jgi:hypothetical protein
MSSRLVAALLLVASTAVAADDGKLDFPTNYREWIFPIPAGVVDHGLM